MSITLTPKETSILLDLIEKEVEISKGILGGDVDNDEYTKSLNEIIEKLEW